MSGRGASAKASLSALDTGCDAFEEGPNRNVGREHCGTSTVHFDLMGIVEAEGRGVWLVVGGYQCTISKVKPQTVNHARCEVSRRDQ